MTPVEGQRCPKLRRARERGGRKKVPRCARAPFFFLHNNQKKRRPSAPGHLLGFGCGRKRGAKKKGAQARPGTFILLFWGSPKASHTKASQPHFPHFPRFVSAFSAFSAFLFRGISSDPCFSRVRGSFRIFRIFPVSGSNR